MQIFEETEKVLQTRRNLLKRNKIPFTQKYFKHEIEKLTIQVSDYRETYQKYFTLILTQHPKKAAKKTVANIRETPTVSLQKNLKIEAQNPPPSAVEEVKTQALQFLYAWRVAEWFKDNPRHLEKETYVHLCHKEKFKQVIYHAFSQEVENHIQSHGRETVYFNPTTQHQDKLYCIAGEIHFGETIERGIFSFCVGQDGILYHRHFTKKTDASMYQFAHNIFYEIDYPLLSKTVDKQPPTSRLYSAPSVCQPIIDELTGAVTLLDPRYSAVKYVLFQSN